MPAPTYSGKFIDWPSFHDAFDQLIHKNSELSNVQRFHYLKKALPIDRDADVHNMLMTNENYVTAWGLIEKRYNNSRILFAHHMNTLYALPILTKETADDIKEMLNAATVCINEFKRLKIPIDTCDHWIAHYLSTKLPTETHKAWEIHLGSETNIPTFDQLKEFLTTKLFTIDAIEHRGIAQNVNNQVHNQQKSTVSNKPKVRSHSTHAFHLKPREQHQKCVLCQQDHILRRCPSFLSKDCLERKDLVIKHKLCLNCLGNSHLLPQCSSTRNCTQCGQRHHSLLHFPKAITNSPPPNLNVELPTINSESHQMTNAHASFATTNTTLSAKPPILLATAIVTLSNPETNISGKFCALIDQGSEGTILSEHVVQTLRLQRKKFLADICGVGENTFNKSKCVVNCMITSRTRTNFSALIEGAISLKASRFRGHTNYKGYIAIFICLATKAIHLEAVTGLTTQHFLWALQRFIGRRGLCTDMYSDCGTNFTGADGK